MESKYLFLCKDKLEHFSRLFNDIKIQAPFVMDIATIAELTSDRFRPTLARFKPGDFFIAIEGTHFKQVEHDVRAYLDSIDKKPFTNFLYLFDGRSCDSKTIYNDKRNAYVLGSGETGCSDPVSFTIYMLNLFEKATLSYRLSDYIYHSFKEVVFGEILKKKTKELETLKEELERRNRIDNLTGLFNRKALFEFLETERSRTIRYLQHISVSAGMPADTVKTGAAEPEKDMALDEIKVENYGIFSIMMIDIDHFKKVNDTYGHLTGDKVLKILGTLFTREGILRKQDIVGRFGGEEFIVILPNTNGNNALGPAIRLVRELDKTDFHTTEKKVFRVTLSIGISEYHPTDKDNEAIIHRADQGMYYAKQHGRNQIIIYEKIFS